MNAARRKTLDELSTEIAGLPIEALKEQIADLQGKLDDIKNQIETVRDEEQESYDNLPESLQNGDKGETMQSAITEMEEAVGAIDAVLETCEAVANISLDDIAEQIETAKGQ